MHVELDCLHLYSQLNEIVNDLCLCAECAIYWNKHRERLIVVGVDFRRFSGRRPKFNARRLGTKTLRPTEDSFLYIEFSDVNDTRENYCQY